MTKNPYGPEEKMEFSEGVEVWSREKFGCVGNKERVC